MKKKDQVSTTYDEMFLAGGNDRVFDMPYRISCYYPMYSAVLKALKANGSNRILEVGCGTGAFAHMVFEKSDIQYHGFDFSPVAVEKAKRRTGNKDAFHVADALDPENYRSSDYSIVCTEVLEHIPNDIELIAFWPSGTLCICSVPNFDSPYHERFFRSEKDIFERYEGWLDIKHITRIKKPILSDISLRNLLRNLRWNRYRPKRLKELLGFGNFDEIGGWFVFSAYRTDDHKPPDGISER